MIMRDLNIMETFKQSVKIKNIEFLRFIFAVFIVYFHLVSGYLFINLGDSIELYSKLNRHCNGYLCVEYFFIIAGFFLITKTNFNIDIIDYAKKKIMRLWPVLAFTLGIYWILSFFTPIEFCKYSNILTLLLVNNVGINTHFGNILPAWYVSAFFWCILLYFYIIKYVPKKHVNFLITVMVIFALSARIHSNGMSAKDVFILNNIGLLRGIYCTGLGYFIGLICLKMSGGGQLSAFNDIWKKLIYTGIEAYLLITVVYNTVCYKSKSPDIYLFYLITFCLLLWFFVNQKGYISKLFNQNFSVFLGKYSYSIYIIHSVVLNLFREYVWKMHSGFVINYPVINLVLPILLAIITGIFLYHLVEKPCSDYLYNKWFSGNKIAKASVNVDKVAIYEK